MWFFLGCAWHDQILFRFQVGCIFRRLLSLLSHLSLKVQNQIIQVLVLFLHPLCLLLLFFELHTHDLGALLLLLLECLDALDLELDLGELLLEALDVDLVVLDQVLELQPVPLYLMPLVIALCTQLLQLLVQQKALVAQLLKLRQLQSMLLSVCILDKILTFLQLRHMIVPEYVHLEFSLAHLAYNALDQRIPIELVHLLIVVSCGRSARFLIRCLRRGLCRVLPPLHGAVLARFVQAERARDLGPVGLQTRKTVLVLVHLARRVVGTCQGEDFVILIEEMRLSIYKWVLRHLLYYKH